MAASGPKKRFAVAGATFLVLLIVSWLWWAHIAKSRLQAKIDELESRHEPVYATDVDLSPIPDNQNAAFFYLSAAAAKSATIISPAESNLTYLGYPPYPLAWHQMEDQAYAANQKAFSIARQARNLDRADWGFRLVSPLSAFFQVNHYFNPMRSLANELGDAALYAHVHDDDADAVQYIFDLLHLADTADQHGFMIGRLVAIGIEALAVERIEVIAVDLQVRDHSNSPNAVDRADVLKLIQQLLDEQTALEHRREMWSFERVLQLDDLFSVRNHSTVLRPLVNLWGVHTIDEFNLRMQAAGQSNWPAARTILAGSPMNSRVIEIEFRSTVERRFAAISLALRLYRLDHGEYPPDLKSLVGEYLPGVPEDPYYAKPQPIGYLVSSKSGVMRPLLYIDPNGSPSTLAPPTFPSFGWQNTGREWRDVSPWWLASAAPTTKPTTR